MLLKNQFPIFNEFQLLRLMLQVATKLQVDWRITQIKLQKSFFHQRRTKKSKTEKEKNNNKKRTTTKMLNRHNFVYSVLLFVDNTFITQHGVTIKQGKKYIIKHKDN